MFGRVLALVIKEFLAILRDGKSRMVLVGPPLIQLLVFGYAASFDLSHVPFAVYDQDRSIASRNLVADFAGSRAFEQVATLHSPRQIQSLIDSRTVEMVLDIDPRFSRDLLTNQPAPVQVIVDGRNSNTALLILGYANTIIADASATWAADHGGATPPTQLDPHALFNPNLDSHWFIIPGIVALLTQVITLLVVGLSIAREREAGTFDQILVTPMRPLDILLGKSIPGMVIGMLEATVSIIAAVYWFDVPLRGGLLDLYTGLLLFTAAVTGIGLMISSISATQQQALLGAFLFMVPSIILSGFATPIANMPALVQDLTWINPMRFALVVIRRCFLEQPSFASLITQYAAMAVLAAISLTVAAVLFQKRSVS
ncbi:ABC transporter permease [Acidiphilium acidophilum]|uniref:ABC transporter permease n=1 Tax=Acidiphilium acidophilum TaxID=76588 RepID=A0AAW9DTQ5_ACIAO|nr:ABC transporter permease [Acidiphilium acidophilum]MDX5932561.1 ABC transporter permease [Acidiphilium acidophilum]